MEFTSTSISTVHDARVAPANHFRPPGGLTPEELRYAVGLVTTRITVLAAGITAYDPDVDPDGVTLRSGLGIMETIAAKVIGGGLHGNI